MKDLTLKGNDVFVIREQFAIEWRANNIHKICFNTKNLYKLAFKKAICSCPLRIRWSKPETFLELDICNVNKIIHTVTCSNWRMVMLRSGNNSKVNCHSVLVSLNEILTFFTNEGSIGEASIAVLATAAISMWIFLNYFAKSMASVTLTPLDSGYCSLATINVYISFHKFTHRQFPAGVVGVFGRNDLRNSFCELFPERIGLREGPTDPRISRTHLAFNLRHDGKLLVTRVFPSSQYLLLQW